MRCPKGHDVTARKVVCWPDPPHGWIAYYCPEHDVLIQRRLDSTSKTLQM